MNDLISKLSEIRSEYNCFNQDEEPYYRALSEVISILSRQKDSDTISRKSAIDALKKAYWDNDLHAAKDDPCVIDAMTDWAIRQIKALPSADSEPLFKIQDILDYLDTVLHPIISPEHWNVYSELYDMISMLPSAERRGRWVKVAEGWGSLWKCDQCGEMTVETVMGKPRANYCPNCGARMSGEQEKRQ